MDEKWAESWKRLGVANARANRERLRSLTLEEALERFEEHCRSVHRAFPQVPARRTHPVGLIKHWKRR